MEDGSSMPLWGVLVLLILLWLNGIFYGFAAAVRNISENETQKKADEGDKKAQMLLALIDRPAQFVNAIPLMVMACGICFGTFLVPWAADVFDPYIKHTPALILVLAVCVILLAGLGILTFRRVGTYYPEKYAYRYLKLIQFWVKVLSPFTTFITWIARLAAVPFGVELDRQESAVTEEEIISIVDEAHEQGVIEENEAEMIQNIISFNETEAHDIMTHRKNVVALESTMTLKETVDFIVKEANNSRFPVYEEDIDNIVGVLHMRDVLYFAEQEEYLDRPISQIDGLLRSAHFAPEAKNINALFKEMQSEKIHMEIVIDEYGQTAGIVTMEDILEEIVGNIMDEYDNEEPDIVVKENGSFQLSGMTPLDDVEDALEMEFDEDDKDNFDTLNGFLISRLGHLPEDDEKGQVVFGGYRFSIVKAENKIIQTVTAERDAGPEHEKENEG